MTKLYPTNFLLAFSFFVPIISFAQAPSISYQSVITGLSAPVDIVNAGDGSNRLFIVEQGGRIKVWNGTTTKLFMDVSSTGANIITGGGEQGLLSMAFHPDYNGTSNRYFFIYYTNLSGDLAVRRYETQTTNTDTVDASSGQTIITIPHPTNNNHNGGKLNFGPDGYLYFATGDGGGSNDVPNNAQNGNVLLGKMLRIDINSSTSQSFGSYGIPADNPYISDAAVLDEIWALGLRNPFRWSFDRANGNMWIGDVGQGAKEEINFRPAGSTGHVNYGWRCYEGYISTPGVADCHPTDNVFPVFDYDNPGTGTSSVIGGFVYRGNEYATLRGRYIATDVYTDDIYILSPNGSGGFDSVVQAGPDLMIVGFGEAEDGTLYAASQGTGSVYKVVASGGTVLPVRLLHFTVKHTGTYNELKWLTGSENNTSGFHVEYSTDAVNFSRAGTVAASRNVNGSNYSYRHTYAKGGTLFYRLAIQEDNGQVNYSSIVKLSVQGASGIRIYPTVIQNNAVTIELDKPATKMQLVNSSGQVVFEKDMRNIAGTTSITLPVVAKGLYTVQVISGTDVKREKLVIE